MKVHRFIGAFDLTPDRLVLQETSLVHQMGRVLRLQVGERIVLCDGSGQEIEGEIAAIDKKSVTIDVKTRRQNLTESPHRVVLYLALIKRENFELAVQKATEVGISEIVPISTQRTVKSSVNLERLQTIAREAAEQSGRGKVPMIHAPLSFVEACKRAKESGTEVFFFDTPPSSQSDSNSFPSSQPRSNPLSSSRTKSDAVRDLDPSPQTEGLRDPSCLGMMEKEIKPVLHALFIGPEGGWTPEEQVLAHKYKFATVSLGPRILRAETAAILASYLLLSDSYLTQF